MGERRDYITRTQDNGKIFISEDVVCSIVEMTVSDLEGIGVHSGITKKSSVKDVTVTFTEDDELCIFCKIFVSVDKNILETAKSVQEAVASAVESVTGFRVKEVNVAVIGVSLPKPAAN